MNRLEEVQSLLAKNSHAIAAKQEEIKSVLAFSLGANLTVSELEGVMDAQIEGWSEREHQSGSPSSTAIDGLLGQLHGLWWRHAELEGELKMLEIDHVSTL